MTELLLITAAGSIVALALVDLMGLGTGLILRHIWLEHRKKREDAAALAERFK